MVFGAVGLTSRFKGSDMTFAQFPDRLAHLVQQTHPSMDVEAHVYPTYETRGSLQRAVDAFVEWLAELVATREAVCGGSGSAGVVLCGHSMGGLVCTDAALALKRNARKGQSAWPRVLGVLAYDTPFLGVNPAVFKHQFNTYQGYMDQAKALGAWAVPPLAAGAAASRGGERSDADAELRRSRWSRGAAWAGAGTVAVAAVAGVVTAAALGSKNQYKNAFDWIREHALFVGNLWDPSAMHARLDACLEEAHVPVRCFYNELSSGGNSGGPRRTFCLVPAAGSAAAPCFVPLPSKAHDEAQAHMTMFQTSSQAYFEMGLDSAALVAQWLDRQKW